ncbi:MAG: T9SS type A sorting domain-containing protein, partial [Bacteroidales bacterium]|nr:T9SS type A sorting domain-containing protein [Bacteroidales bacterium]
LSNPYMGRIDVRTLCETGLTNEQGEGTVYIYNPDKNRWETPIEIYPSQGFMVASASSTGDITLTGTLSKSQLLGSFNGKKTTTQTTPYSYITFASQANNTTKEAFARITDDASNGFDQRDAYVMLSSNNQDLVEPYFLVDNHSIMKNIFKTMPYYCPINFHASKISDVSFVVSNIPDNVKVSIINVSDSTETALTNGSVFNFIANQGENNGRFVIKFGQNSSSITDNIQSNNNLSIWNNNNEININGYNLKKVEVVNMIGQTVYAKEISGENFKFNLNVNPGAYVVKVKSHNNINQQKIIIK